MENDILKEKLSEMKNHEYDSRVNHFIKEIKTLGLPKTTLATRLLLTEMTAEKGFTRHDNRDYYEHPIAVAQMALDFEIISNMIRNNDYRKADILLTTCLLHDILEDVKHISPMDIEKDFGRDVLENVDNVSKRNGEPLHLYVDRFSSNEISALVKILDRFHNVSTLDNSSLKHRQKQLIETREVYLPLTKIFRRRYWEYRNFYFQARMDITSKLNLVEKLNNMEETVNKLTLENANLKRELENKKS